MSTPKVGDWIRFQAGGVLVIGIVAYIRPRASWERVDFAITAEHGEVPVDRILELRPAPEGDAERGR